MTLRIFAVFAITFAASLDAQSVTDPRASLIDVSARHAQLSHNHDARTAEAISALGVCATFAVVVSPGGRMIIPPHYLGGGHGPVNPEEAKATRGYNAFEEHVTAGMNQWLVTASKDEARCGQQQIDLWAQADSLLAYDPKESSQAWCQVEWTLSSVAITESVLVNESSLDPVLVKRDIDWMKRVAHRCMDFDKAARQTNNHHDWRGLAAVATGVIDSDDELFRWSIDVYKQAIDELDQRGAMPQEMGRHERAIHYQSFALQPLIPLAEFAERQHISFYNYRSPSGRTIFDAVNFFGAAVANPALVKAYTPDEQLLEGPGGDFFAFAEFYSHHVEPGQMPASIVQGLAGPAFASRIGGSVTVLDGYTESATRPSQR